MSLAAGTITPGAVTATTATLVSAAATGGTGPYTYQWYMSTTTSFSPGSGNLISGATALTLNASGLIPNTAYFFKVIATDTGNSNVTATSSQATDTTAVSPVQQPNQFGQTTIAGMLDMKLNTNTIPVQIDLAQTGSLYPGQAMKVATTAGGVIKVIAITADTDDVFCYLNFSRKDASFVAGQMAEASLAGNVMYLYANGAVTRGKMVVPDVTAQSAVIQAVGDSGNTIVGRAIDAAAAAGVLIRVYLVCPSNQVA